MLGYFNYLFLLFDKVLNFYKMSDDVLWDGVKSEKRNYFKG